MAERQRCAIEFCVRLGKSGSETLQLIHQAYGDDAMRRAAVFKWWKRFRNKRTWKLNLVAVGLAQSLFHYPPEACGGLQHVFEKWVERCKKCMAFQGRYFEKGTITELPQSSDSE